MSAAYFLTNKGLDIESYAFVSVYLQSFLLISLALICWLKKGLNSLRPIPRLVTVVTLLVLVGVLIEFITYAFYRNHLDRAFDLDVFTYHRLIAVLLMIFLLISGFNLVAKHNQSLNSHVMSRYQALQSRIRPHFLFNSLNTISELTHVNPDHAEKAINSLSLLFRAGMENMETLHSLQSEVNLSRRYIELERWRLGKKLVDNWNIEVEDQAAWQIPKLILQPLVENAVVHGQLKDGSVHLTVDIQETPTQLGIYVENKMADSKSDVAGNGIAVENIRERLFVLYDDKYKFKVRSSNGKYHVFMRLPKQLGKQI